MVLLSQPEMDQPVSLRSLFCLLAVAATCAAIPGAARAADAMGGKKIAGQWCASCHATATGRRANDTAPAFTELANDPARTPVRLRAWLTDPHPPMPNLGLSRIEIEDVIAYIGSLRAR